MDHLANIWEFKTKNFVVRVDALADHDLDLSWDEDGSAAEGLKRGELVAFCARATVLFNGAEIGCDYLGNCIYRSFEDFRTDGGYFPDMVRCAIREARIFASNLPRLHA